MGKAYVQNGEDYVFPMTSRFPAFLHLFGTRKGWYIAESTGQKLYMTLQQKWDLSEEVQQRCMV